MRVRTLFMLSLLAAGGVLTSSCNRAEGGRRWAAVVLVGLLLAVAGYVVVDALAFVVGTWL